MSLRNWSLKTKTLIAFASVATCLAGVGAMGRWSLTTTKNEYSRVAKINLPDVVNLSQLIVDMGRERAIVLELGLSDFSNSEIEKTKKQLEDRKKSFDQAEKNYLAIEFQPGEKELWESFRGEWTKAETNIQTLLKMAEAGERDKFHQLAGGDFRAAGREAMERADKLVDYHHELGTSYATAAEKSASAAGWRTSIAVILGCLLAMTLGYLYSRWLGTSLAQVSESMANGASQVADASRSISGASESLSASSTQQAAALGQTAASIEQMNAMVAKSNENAERSKQTAQTSQQSATRGREAITQMIQSIEEIARSNSEVVTQIESGNREIAQIVQVISEIGNKTKVINDIVFQTKLLSFNASVEAARAGEHGKGFAVVAEEVGNLAQMSGNAAKEISSLLEGSIQKVESIVSQTTTRVGQLVSAGRDKVDAGTQMAHRCGEVLEDIVRSSGEMNRMTDEIASATREQAQGIAEITKAMNQLDQVTHQNAAASQQAASAASELSAQAEKLREMVQGLNALVKGAETQTLDQPRIVAVETNVVPLEKARKKANARQKEKQKQKQQQPSEAAFERTPSLKKAVGTDIMPSEDDPRFHDV